MQINISQITLMNTDKKHLSFSVASVRKKHANNISQITLMNTDKKHLWLSVASVRKKHST